MRVSKILTYLLYGFGILGLCFISYNLGKIQSQINKLPSQTTTQISNPVVDDVVIAERRIPRIRRYPYHPIRRESKWMNLTNIRPIIQLNKEVYHINDKFKSRVLFMNTENNTISSATQFLYCNSRLIMPNQQNILIYGMKNSISQIFETTFHNHRDYPEGLYTQVVECGDNKFSFNKTFLFSNIKENRVYTDISFDKPAYQPGDQVHVSLTVTPLNGFSLTQAVFTVLSSINGESTELYKGSIDHTLNLTFSLPSITTITSSSLFCTMKNHGEIETASKIIPISSIRILQVIFHPEGGRIGCGSENRIYFAAMNDYHEPVTITGIMKSSTGQEEGEVKIGEDGRGLISSLVVKQDIEYTLHIVSPIQYQGQSFILPKCEILPVMTVSLKEEKVHVIVMNDQPIKQKLELSLYKQTHCIQRLEFYLSSKQKEFDLNLSKQYGVLRVLLKVANPSSTVFSLNDYLQERLVFVFPPSSSFATLSIMNSTSHETTHFEVQQNVTVHIESSQKAKGFVYLVDKKNIQQLEAFSHQFMIYYLLQTDLLTVPPSIIHFFANHNIIEMDYLMGCQSWRRFLFYDPNHPYKDDYDRITGSIHYRQWNHPPHLYMRAKAFSARGFHPMNNMDAAVEVEEDTVAEAAVVTLGGAIPAARKASPPKPAIMPMKRIPSFYFPYPIPKQSDNSLFWKDDISIDNTSDLIITSIKQPSTYLLYTNLISESGSILEQTTELVFTKSFDYSIKTPYLLTINENDHCLIPLTIYNSYNSSVITTFNCSIKNNLWKASCHQNYRVSPQMVDRSYITLQANNGFKKQEKKEWRQSKRSQFHQRHDYSLDSPLFNFAPIKTEFSLSLVNQSLGIPDETPRIVPMQIESTLFPIQEMQLIHIQGKEELITYNLTIQLPQEHPEYTELSITSLNRIESLFMYSLDGLIREPHGCFEQTSSTLYPMLLATSLLRRHSDFVLQGIKRLLTFEVSGGGFSLFGRAPASPSLTAYGILEFDEILRYLQEYSQFNESDDLLKQVEESLHRAEKWLLSEEAIESNWCSKPSMDSIGRSSCNTTMAYIYYALSKRELPSSLVHQILSLYDEILLSPSSYSTYIIALEGLSLINQKHNKKALRLQSILLERQEEDGSFNLGKETITRSGNQGVFVETSALVAMNLLSSPEQNAAALARVTYFLLNNQKNGVFATTQGTILSLQFLQQYISRETASIAFTIQSDESHSITQHYFSSLSSVTSESFRELLYYPQLHLQFTIRHPSSHMYFALNMKSAVSKPPSSSSSSVAMNWMNEKASIEEGEVFTPKLHIENTGKELFMMTAVIGIPAGVDLQIDHFVRLKERNEIDYFEIRGKTLVVYWMNVKSEFNMIMDLPMIGSIPGTYHAAASYLYEYYDKRNCVWIDGMELVVKVSV